MVGAVSAPPCSNHPPVRFIRSEARGSVPGVGLWPPRPRSSLRPVARRVAAARAGCAAGGTRAGLVAPAVGGSGRPRPPDTLDRRPQRGGRRGRRGRRSAGGAGEPGRSRRHGRPAPGPRPRPASRLAADLPRGSVRSLRTWRPSPYSDARTAATRVIPSRPWRPCGTPPHQKADLPAFCRPRDPLRERRSIRGGLPLRSARPPAASEAQGAGRRWRARSRARLSGRDGGSPRARAVARPIQTLTNGLKSG